MLRTPNSIRQVRKRAVEPVKEEAKAEEGILPTELLVPSGSSMLNLACSDNIHGAYRLGTFVNEVGGTQSGKTLNAFSMFAECAQLPRFDDYDLIYDEPEVADEFNKIKLFGEKMAARIRAPNYIKEGKTKKAKASATIQEFKLNVGRAIREKPCIYVLDSLDGISDEEELKRFDAELKGKDISGTYGMAKAKGGSELCRILAGELKDTLSLLVIISQIRDNPNALPFQKKDRRSGGRALEFYASIIVWLTTIGSLKEQGLDIGQTVKASVTKNKLTGNKRVITYNTYTKHGIDDTNSIIDFMLELDLWKKETHGRQGTSIIIPEINIDMNRDELVDKIESEYDFKQQLLDMVQRAWLDREKSVTPKRRPKYG